MVEALIAVLSRGAGTLIASGVYRPANRIVGPRTQYAGTGSIDHREERCVCGCHEMICLRIEGFLN